MTKITRSNTAGTWICGTIVEKIMQVYTTIFLAETLTSNTWMAEESTGDFTGRFIGDVENKRGPFEIKRISLKRISKLEARNWFADDLPSEDQRRRMAPVSVPRVLSLKTGKHQLFGPVSS